MMFELGTEPMTAVGTYDGTLLYEMMTAPGYELMVMMKVLGTYETQVAGTTTGLFQLVGITTVDGVTTQLVAGTAITFDVGIVSMR
jgi:hypothetical protein